MAISVSKPTQKVSMPKTTLPDPKVSNAAAPKAASFGAGGLKSYLNASKLMKQSTPKMAK